MPPEPPAPDRVQGANIAYPGPSSVDPYGAPQRNNPRLPNAKRAQREFMRMQLDQMRQYRPVMDSAIRQLIQGANTFDPESSASRYAPDQARLNDYFSRAEGELGAQMAGRGLSDSSAMSSGLGALAGAHASARGGLASRIFGEERDRQRMDQAQLRDVVLSLMGRTTAQGANIAGDMRSANLQQQQLDLMSGGGGFFGDLLSGLGGAAGLAGGLGWRPFRRTG